MTLHLRQKQQSDHSWRHFHRACMRLHHVRGAGAMKQHPVTRQGRARLTAILEKAATVCAVCHYELS